eukprot:8529606-Alexandrium_andersonii.AAC.1
MVGWPPIHSQAAVKGPDRQMCACRSARCVFVLRRTCACVAHGSQAGAEDSDPCALFGVSCVAAKTISASPEEPGDLAEGSLFPVDEPSAQRARVLAS